MRAKAEEVAALKEQLVGYKQKLSLKNERGEEMHAQWAAAAEQGASHFEELTTLRRQTEQLNEQLAARD